MNSSYAINQANISITVTRWCNRRCTHCYIAPEELANKEQMSSDVFRNSIIQSQYLIDFDHNLKEVEWEVIGGEATALPIEFWYQNLDWALDQIKSFNKKLSVKGSLNFLTNLFFTDDRYLELFNRYEADDTFCLYTSWEPDTNRFGKNNKLFDKWCSRLSSIKVRNKILDVILTKEVIRLGPEYLVSTFIPLGVNDFSIKMISPYGSGKDFWAPNMPSFQQIDDYLVELSELLPDGITFTPCDEIQSSLFRNTSYQCQGNFRYDLAIEPDGTTTFNASQTADESSVGFRTISINDPLWPVKTVLENSFELARKQLLRYDKCNTCEFYNRCNGGWYHYRTEPESLLLPYGIETDCPGYRALWKFQSGVVGISDRTDMACMSVMESFINNSAGGAEIRESNFTTYDDLVAFINEKRPFVMHMDVMDLHGKGYTERLIGYESFPHVGVCINDAAFMGLPISEKLRVVETVLYLNAAVLPDHGLDFVVRWALTNIEQFEGTLLSDILVSFVDGVLPSGLNNQNVIEPYSVLSSIFPNSKMNFGSHELASFISSMRTPA